MSAKHTHKTPAKASGNQTPEGLEAQAWAALSKVEEPDLKKDLVSLKMIEDLKITQEGISFKVILTTPACPLKEVIRERCHLALIEALGKGYKIQVDFDARVTSGAQQKNSLPGIKNIIGIASGKGGVGKSSVAANLAVILAEQGARTGLLDADIFGPSVPTLFCCRGEKPHIFKKEGRNFIEPLVRYGVSLMSIGFLVEDAQAVMWRGPMASTALKQLLGDTEWGTLDYLLVDLPPGTSDIPMTLAQSFSVTGVVVVSSAQAIALADVRKSIAMCYQPQLKVPILGLVENMSYFEAPASTPGDTPSRHYLFGKGGVERLAEETGLPLLASLAIHPAISTGNDEGYPAALRPGAAREDFLKLSQRLAQQIAIQNATQQVVHA